MNTNHKTFGVVMALHILFGILQRIALNYVFIPLVIQKSDTSDMISIIRLECLFTVLFSAACLVIGICIVKKFALSDLLFSAHCMAGYTLILIVLMQILGHGTTGIYAGSILFWLLCTPIEAYLSIAGLIVGSIAWTTIFFPVFVVSIIAIYAAYFLVRITRYRAENW